MDIEYKGGNCVVITHKKETFITDPKLSLIGLKDQGQNAAVQLLTQSKFETEHGSDTLVINGPGEYEVFNFSVVGVAAHAHTDDPSGHKMATMYKLDLGDISLAVIGHAAPELTQEQLEALGIVDILIIPVGNHGYTLDAKAAVEIVRQVNPKIVIPTHYADDEAKYEVPQAPVDEFLKELGGTSEELPKLKIKSGQLPEVLTAYRLTRVK